MQQSEVAQLPLSHRLLAWFDANRKPAMIGALVIVVVGFIIGYVVWQHGQTQVAAGTAFTDAAAGQIGMAIPRANPSQAYLAVVSKYPNAPAGAQALLMAAVTSFTDGKFADSQAQFERFVREYHDSEFMGDALLGIGACYDAQGKADQAVAAYKNLYERHPNAAAVPQAKFALARIYEAQAKPELARDLYEELERYPYSSIANDAAMRLEELTAKFPKLAAAAAIPTNTTFRIEKK
jgi:TolA-binding protein